MTEHKLKSWSNFYYTDSTFDFTSRATYNCSCGFSRAVSAPTYGKMTTELKEARIEHEREMKQQCVEKILHYLPGQRDSQGCYTWDGQCWISDEELYASREANKLYSSNYLDRQIEIAEQAHSVQIERLLREKARLEALPKEPNATADGDNSILFKIKFANNNPYYTYVATYVEAMNVWYVSGPTQKNNGGYHWDSLVNWITRNPKWEIWHVSEYVQLASSE